MVVTHGRPQDFVPDVAKPPKKQKLKVHHHHLPHPHLEKGVSLDTATTIVAMETKGRSHKKGSKLDGKKPVKVTTKVSAKNVLMSEHGGTTAKGSKVVGIKKEEVGTKRDRGMLSDSSSEDDDIDVTTPVDMELPLNVSLKRSLIQQDTGSDTFSTLRRSLIQEDTSDAGDRGLIRFDTSNTLAKKQPKSFKVSINRGALHQSNLNFSDTSFSERLTGLTPTSELPSNSSELPSDHHDEYRIEYDGSSKMIIRSGTTEEAPKKKKKKDKKKKSKHAKKRSRSESFTHEVESDSEQKVTYLEDPLKLKIKLQ